MTFSINSVKTQIADLHELMGSRKGIKTTFADSHLAAKRFARQQCRAWIETCAALRCTPRGIDSPGSNAGRGLKQNDLIDKALINAIRPAAMPGVD